MSDYLERTSGGTVFSGSDQNIFYVLVLRNNLVVYRKTGLLPHRGVTLKMLLEMATSYTGKKYKRTELEKAENDLLEWAEKTKKLPRVD